MQAGWRLAGSSGSSSSRVVVDEGRYRPAAAFGQSSSEGCARGLVSESALVDPRGGRGGNGATGKQRWYRRGGQDNGRIGTNGRAPENQLVASVSVSVCQSAVAGGLIDVTCPRTGRAETQRRARGLFEDEARRLCKEREMLNRQRPGLCADVGHRSTRNVSTHRAEEKKKKEYARRSNSGTEGIWGGPHPGAHPEPLPSSVLYHLTFRDIHGVRWRRWLCI